MRKVLQLAMVLVLACMGLAAPAAVADPVPGGSAPSPLQGWIDGAVPAPPLAPASAGGPSEALWKAILSTPTGDSTFDAWPADLAAMRPGQLIESRDVTAAARALVDAPIARAVLLKYRSTSATGAPSFGTATFLVPSARWTGSGTRPVDVDTMPINALGLRCNPGYTIAHEVHDNSDINVFLPAVGTALHKGQAVLVPDHEGPLVSYAEPTVAGHMTLDSMRAVRALYPNEFRDSRFAVTGYSGGAIAAYATTMLLREYAPELAGVLVGAAIGGLVTDYVTVAHVFNGHSASGILLSVSLAIAREHPEMLEYLNHLGQWAAISPLKNVCGDADGPLGAVGIPIDVAANIDHPLESDIAAHIDRLTNLTNRTAATPLYLYHGADDFWIPIAGPREVYKRQCALGIPAEFHTLPGEHVTAMINGGPGATAWIDARLAGVPAPNECPVIH